MAILLHTDWHQRRRDCWISHQATFSSAHANRLGRMTRGYIASIVDTALERINQINESLLVA
jgi:hypothetical protein